MAKEKCPNCGHYELGKKWATGKWGCVWGLLFISVAGLMFAPVVGQIFGVLFILSLIIAPFLPKDKEITMECENCKYECVVKRK